MKAHNCMRTGWRVHIALHTHTKLKIECKECKTLLHTEVYLKVPAGYGVEATKYVTGLLQFGLIRREDLWLTQVSDKRGWIERSSLADEEYHSEALYQGRLPR